MSWWWIPSAAWDAGRRSWRAEEEPAPASRAPRKRRSDAALTNAQVVEIRELGGRNRAGHPSLAEGLSYADLARRFGVSKALIRAVVKGYRYSEVR